jgi:drug/metabolite transporter (DMT)-like permease
MDTRFVGIGFVLLSVTLLTSAQFIIKSRLTVHGSIPFAPGDLLRYLLVALGDWRLWLGGIGLVLASFSWYVAVSRIPLSIAFPFGALSYPIVFLGSVLFLREPFSWTALLGNGLIIAGVALAVAVES